MIKTDENPDYQFLQLAAQGDQQAFGVLYRRYLDEIYRFVYFKVGSKPTAEDITEVTFTKTWEILPSIYKQDGGIENLRAWLYRIANNLVIDFYRKNRLVEHFEKMETGKSPSTEAIAIEHEEVYQVAHAIRKLKPEFQEIIILRLINELSHKEAASIMHISEANSRVLLYRALKRLKANLGN